MKKYPSQPVKTLAKGVPMVMQMELSECGPASLTMIFAHYGLWLPLEKLRQDCGSGRNGTNAATLQRVAKHHGFNVKGFRCSEDALQSQGLFPCIVFWEEKHFVVLNGFRGNKVSLNNPAYGQEWISMEEFRRGYSGVYLQIAPDETFVPQGSPPGVGSFLKTHLNSTKAAIALILLTAAITAVVDLAQPAFARFFVDVLLPGGSQVGDWRLPFLLLLSGVFVISLLNGLLKSIQLLKLQGKLELQANASFVWHLLRLPVSFFSQRSAGDLVQRQDQHEVIAKTLLGTVVPLVMELILVVLYLTVMLRYSLVLTGIGLLSLAVQVAFRNAMSKHTMNLTRRQLRNQSQRYAATISGLDMIETIKASGGESGFFAQWAGYDAQVNQDEMTLTRYIGLWSGIPLALSSLVNVGILVWGVRLIVLGEMSVGALLAFQGIYASIQLPLAKLLEAGQAVDEMRMSAERIEDVFRYAPDVEREEVAQQGEDYSKLSGAFTLKNVSFGYQPFTKPLVEDVSLSVPSGTWIALVGKSGCGKSTLAGLIAGLHTPWSGEISMDGRPLREIPPMVRSSSLVFVEQNVRLFADSIPANLKLWDKSIEDYEMVMAARDASIHDEITKRQGGYSYVMEENGQDFSGGQRQRLELARALAQDPSILILDEATSALDVQTERAVLSAIARRGITCITVAHRLSTIRDCDEILVMDQGHLVERGTHEALMALGGHYADMVKQGGDDV